MSDLVGKSELQAKEALLTGVKRERTKPQESPKFPLLPSPQRYTTINHPQFPGTLPPIWSVPHQRNPNFIGRNALLTELHDALITGKQAALTQAIVGLGGIGKTQLAIEYAYHYAAEYKIIWWLRAEEPVGLTIDYVELARILNLCEQGKDDYRVIMRTLRRWLSQNTNWLLIFDNADKPADIYDYLPQSRTGHVLITSRNQNWSELVTELQVPVLERDKSIEFLLLRTGQADSKTANDLAKELGDLPLALEHATAYINSVRITSLKEYLDLFCTRRQELMKRANPPLSYHATVATTWEMSFQKVQQQSTAAAELISLSAFLAPERIPQWLLDQQPHQLVFEHYIQLTKVARSLSDELAKQFTAAMKWFLKSRQALRQFLGQRSLPSALAKAVQDKVIFNDSIAVLNHYSLIAIDKEAWSVHRLVQAVARERQGEREKRRYTKMAVRLIDEAFPKQVDIKTWPVCVQLLPHALLAVERAERLQVSPTETVGLMNQIGTYFLQIGHFVAAKEILQRALNIAERVFGSKHRILASVLNNLGAVMEAQGDLEQARLYVERAINLGGKGLLNIFYRPSRLNNLGEVLRRTGNTSGAKACFERALEMAEKMHGANNIQVAGIADNYGLLLQDLGDLKGARLYIERALKIYELTYGSDHPDTAIAYNNLGRVFAQQGNLTGARMYAERSLMILRKTLGDDHPTTKVTQENLEAVKKWNKSGGLKAKTAKKGRRKKRQK